MLEFPPSLLEILLDPRIGEDAEVTEIAKEALPITLSDIVRPAVRILQRHKSELESERTELEGKKSSGEIHYGWPARNYDARLASEAQMKRLEQLPSHIAMLDKKLREIKTETKRFEDEGYIVPAYSSLPPSVQEDCVVLPDFIAPTFEWPLNLYPKDNYPKARLFKVKPINVVPLSEIANNLQDYEGELVITEGVIIGQAQNIGSIDIDSEGSTQRYVETFSFIAEDKKTSKFVKGGYNNPHDTYKRGTSAIIIPTTNGPRVQETGIYDVFMRLDAAKTKGKPIVIGGMVRKGQIYADMFVIEMGSGKQILAYLNSTIYQKDKS